LEFSSQKDLTSSMLRFQEYYESPKFRGKFFSLDEFISWYKKTKNGRFSNFSDWSGFNFPSKILKAFRNGNFGKLTRRERIVLNSLPKEGKFYVIATHKSRDKNWDQSVMDHEVAHSLFYLNKNYRRQALKILEKVKLKPIFKYLKKLGYAKSVFLDEAHAYLGVDSLQLRRECIDLDPYRKSIKKLNKLLRSRLS
jgi:hypothetical protein